MVLILVQLTPLGTTISADGVNFAVFSQHATGFELLLFNEHDVLEPKIQKARLVTPLCNQDRLATNLVKHAHRLYPCP